MEKEDYEFFTQRDLRRVVGFGKEWPIRSSKVRMVAADVPFMVEASLERCFETGLKRVTKDDLRCVRTLPRIKLDDVAHVRQLFVGVGKFVEENLVSVPGIPADFSGTYDTEKDASELNRARQAYVNAIEHRTEAISAASQEQHDELEVIKKAFEDASEAHEDTAAAKNRAATKEWSDAYNAETIRHDEEDAKIVRQIEEKRRAYSAAEQNRWSVETSKQAEDNYNAGMEAKRGMLELERKESEELLKHENTNARLARERDEKLAKIQVEYNENMEDARKEQSDGILDAQDAFDDVVDAENAAVAEAARKLTLVQGGLGTFGGVRNLYEAVGWKASFDKAWKDGIVRFPWSNKTLIGHGWWTFDKETGLPVQDHPVNYKSYLYLAETIRRIYCDLERLKTTYAEAATLIRDEHKWNETYYRHKNGEETNTQTSGVNPEQTMTDPSWSVYSTRGRTRTDPNVFRCTYRYIEEYGYPNFGITTQRLKSGGTVTKWYPLENYPFKLEEKYDITRDSGVVLMKVANYATYGTVSEIEADVLLIGQAYAISRHHDWHWVLDEEQGLDKDKPGWGTYSHLENSDNEPITVETATTAIQDGTKYGVVFRMVHLKFKKRKDVDPAAAGDYEALLQEREENLVPVSEQLEASLAVLKKEMEDRIAEKRSEIKASVEEIEVERAKQLKDAREATCKTIFQAKKDLTFNNRVREILFTEGDKTWEERWNEVFEYEASYTTEIDKAWSDLDKTLMNLNRGFDKQVDEAKAELKPLVDEWKTRKAALYDSSRDAEMAVYTQIEDEMRKLPNPWEIWEAEIQQDELGKAAAAVCGVPRGDTTTVSDSWAVIGAKNVLVRYEPRTATGIDYSDLEDEEESEWGKLAPKDDTATVQS